MFHFNCDTCGYSRNIDYLPREYVFDDGRRLPMIQRHIWCSQCETITVAEAFGDDCEMRERRRERCEKHRRELERNDFKHDFEADLRRKWIAETEAYERDLAEWGFLRVRPQFCLKCGNESIIVPENAWSDLFHSLCGGLPQCSATNVAGTFIGPEPHKYTINGEFIELGYRQGPFEGDQRKPLELWWANGT
jgi:hypothetical protein